MSGAGFQPRSIVRRTPLLSSCAIAAALVAGGHSAPVRAQAAAIPNPSYLATGSSADATIFVGTGATPSTTISVNQSTAIIDWTPTDNATGTTNNINFQAGGTATFFSDLPGFTVLNRVVPATGAGGFIRAIEFNGATTTSSPNGAVWFYSPGGIVAGPTAMFDVGSLVLTANDIDTTGGLFGTGGEIRFRGAAGSRASVTIQPGADLRATSEGSYIALVAPRIDQGGTVTVNGSAAYVAAESADITINSGLFNFAVTAGSTVDAGGETTLRHTGTTTGPAPGSTADPHAIYMVAIPKNDAVTMLISGTGTLGYASSASVENGVVILSAGANITSTANGLGGADVAATAGPAPGIDAFIDIAGGSVTSRLTGIAVTDATASARLTNSLSFSGNLELAAGRKASLVANAGETIMVDGSVGLTSLGLSPFGIPTPGEASLRALGGGSVTINGVAAINASATAAVGNAVGGTAALEVNESTMTIGAGAFLSADGQGGVGGNGQGGVASVSVVRTALNVGGAISISATGRGGRGQDGGSGAGGAASLTTDEGNVTISTGLGFGSLNIDAGGFGASGSSNSSGGDGGNGGAGTGGTASLTATNGGGYGISSITLSAGGVGGSGGSAFEFGYGASGNGGNGGNGLGGMSIASISQTSITGGSLSLDATGISGGGGFSDSAAGGNAGNATGGTAAATIADVTSASFPLGITIDARAFGGGEGEGGGGSNMLATGGLGGTSTGGTARLTLTNSTLTTASVNITSDAEASDGGVGITRGAASGAATGGTSELIVQNGSLTTGDVSVSATADAGEDENADRGGNARGGTARIALNGGVATFAASVGVDASAGSDEEPESTGDAFGGSAQFLAQNLSSLDIVGNLAILADAAAGINATGIGGASTGGSASLTVEQSSLAVGSSGLNLSATAYGADAAIMGGAATGGSATITVNAGDLTFSTPLSIAANGIGGDGGSGGAGTGGAVRLIVNGGSIGIPDDLFLSALGQGGRSDVGGDAGIGRGGIVSIFSGGSSLLASILRGSIALQNVTLDARGIGGTANEFGYGSTGGGDGGAAFGGDISIEARNGDIIGDVESTVSLLASGMGGASFDGGASGDATGGSVAILASADVNGAGSIDLPVAEIDLSGMGGDPFETGYGIPSGEKGGSGAGGEATILAGAGELAIASLSVNAQGVGARGDDGGNGAGGDGGDGAGGAILLGTTGGTLTLSSVDLSAAGRGGDGGQGDNGEDGGAGGAATGGGVTIQAADQSLAVFNASIDIRADGGSGGDGGFGSAGDGGAGGDGGAATGGEFIAQAQGVDGVLELGSISVSNESRGGDGGFGGSGATGGRGGIGGAAIGGLFEISTELGTATLFSGEGLSIPLVANAFGGDGGGGGDGFEVGDTGGIGGNGGAGTGGVARIDVNGGLVESDFTELIAQGEGGRGGDGGIGAGTPFIPGNPEAIPPIDDIPAGPVTFAARGFDGQGSGGAVTIRVNDNADTGAVGSATLSETMIDTSGFTPDDDGSRFTDTAGRIEISDLGSDPDGGLIISNLTATSGGFAPTSDQAFDISSAGRRIEITNDATVNVGGPAYFRASGAGGVDIGGALDIGSNSFVSVEHDSQPSTFVSTISADSIDIRASANVRAFPDSLITSANAITILSESGRIDLNIANAGTNIDLEAPGDITADVLNAGTDIDVAAGGDVEVSTDIVAGGLIRATGDNVTLNAINLLDVDSAAATEGNIMLASGGPIAVRVMSATANITLDSAGTIDIATDTAAGGGIALYADDGITTRNLLANNSILANSTNGGLDLQQIESVGGSVRLAAGGDFSIGDVRAAGSIFLTGGGAITAGDLTAGAGPLLPGEEVMGGTDPALPGIAPGFDGLAIPRCDDCFTSTVPLPFAINYFGTTYTATFVSTNGYLTFNTGQGAFTPSGLGAGYGGQPIIAAFFADVDTRNAGSAQATYGAGTFAGRQAFGATWNNVGYFRNQADKLNSFQLILTDRSDTGTGNFDIYYNYTNISWETGSASGGVGGFGGTSAAVGYNAGTGNQTDTFFELPGSRVPGSFLNGGPAPLITGTNNGNPGQLLFSVRNGQVVAGGFAEPPTIHVSNLAATASNADIMLGDLSAEAVEVHGAAGVTVGNVDVGDRNSEIEAPGQPFATVLDAATSLTAGDIFGSGLVALGAGLGDLAIGTITTPSSVTVLAGGAVVLGPVTTGVGATDSLFISNPSILASNPALVDFSFDSLLSSDAFDPEVLASLTPVRTGGAITLAGPVSTGNLVAAAGGAARLGEVDASNRVSVDSGAMIGIDGAVTGVTIDLSSADIAIGATALVGDAETTSLSFRNNGAGPTLVGGSNAGAGYALSNAEFGRAQAARIIISGTSDVSVGALDIIGSSGADTATRRRNLTGSELDIQTPGSITINGAVALTSAGAEDSILLSAGQRINVVTPDGSISVLGAQNALAGRVVLSADQVVIAGAQAAQDIAAPGLSTDDIDERLGTNDGAAKPEGYLQAGALEFNVQSALYIQNSGGPGLGSTARAGFTAGSGGVRIDTGESSVARIIINGRQANGQGGFTGGADLIPLLTINGSRSPTGGFDLRSTANGCLIVGMSCLPATVPPVQDVIKEILSQSSDETGNDGTAVVQLLNLPLIQLVDLSGLGFIPLIDEPVTGAGNDDLWMADPSE